MSAHPLAIDRTGLVTSVGLSAPAACAAMMRRICSAVKPASMALPHTAVARMSLVSTELSTVVPDMRPMA